MAPFSSRPITTSQARKVCFRHFAAIARQLRCQLVLYNIPGRCAVDIAADTVVALAADYPNIVSIKEASGSVDRVSELRAPCAERFHRLERRRFADPAFLSVGAVGVVSVASNLFPAEVVQLVSLFATGDAEIARRTSPAILRRFSKIFSLNQIRSRPRPSWPGAA